LIENAHSTQILDEEKHFPYKRKREGQPLKKLPGGTKMLSALADTDFFNEPRAIAEICHTLTAFFSGGEKKFATAEISGLLITLVKRNVLIRSKDPVSRRYVYQFPEKKNSTKADLFNHA
jgi:hypothetical protein